MIILYKTTFTILCSHFLNQRYFIFLQILFKKLSLYKKDSLVIDLGIICLKAIDFVPEAYLKF